MLGLLGRRGPPKSKRLAPRRPRDASIYVFDRNRFVGQAALLDDSDLGVRLRSHTPGVLEGADFILDADRATVLELQLAWRRGNEAGYQIVSQAHLRGFIANPAIEHITTFWSQIALNHGVAAPRGVFGRASPTTFGSAGRTPR